MKPLLLDANVLLALAWPNHPFHRKALARVDLRSRLRWATCLLTQAAFIRLSSNPAIVSLSIAPAEAGHILQTMVADRDHVFLEAQPARRAMLDPILRRCQGHNRVNDAFLLWLALIHGATVLTFDAPLRYLAPKAELVEVIG